MLEGVWCSNQAVLSQMPRCVEVLRVGCVHMSWYWWQQGGKLFETLL